MKTLEDQLAAYGEQRREARAPLTNKGLNGRFLLEGPIVASEPRPVGDHDAKVAPVRSRSGPRRLPIWVAGVAVAAATLLGIGLASWFTGAPLATGRTTVSPETPATTDAAVRHSVDVDGILISFDIPASGWAAHGDFAISKDVWESQPGAEAIIYFATFPGGPDAVRCPDLAFGRLPDTTDIDLIARSLNGRVDDYAVGGLQGSFVEVEVREGVGCDPGYLYSWPAPPGGEFWTESQTHDIVDVWFIKVDGGVLAVVAETRFGVRRQLGAEIFEIIDSTRFPSMVQPATADYIIDMVTGETTLLPAAIRNLAPSQYAASPDGSMLAFVAPDGDGSFQLFTAGIDGTDIRQITHPPLEASGPAWSPDGSLVAYVQSGGLFVLDVATGDSGRIPDVDANGLSTQFTPEGSSILYGNDGVWIVPIDGGSSTQLIGRDNGVETGGGSMSPDGSLVTFNGNRINGPGAIRFLADADGSNVRELGQLDGGNCGWSGASGIWSPDGARTVCAGNDEVRVVYVATGEDSVVAKGKAAIWLDDHTLLVEAWGG